MWPFRSTRGEPSTGGRNPTFAELFATEPGAAVFTLRDAFSVPAVFAALRLLIESVSSLPVDVEGTTRPAWTVDPIPDEREMPDLIAEVMFALLVYGDAWLYARRDTAGRVAGVYAVPNHRIVADRESTDLFASVRHQIDGQTVPSGRVFQVSTGVRGPGDIYSMAPLRAAMDHAAISWHGARHVAALLRNHMAPRGVLETAAVGGVSAPMEISPKALQQTKNALRAMYASPEGKGSAAVLPPGMTFKAVQLTAADAELDDTRKATIAEIARAFGIPNHMIGDATNSTSWGSGIESMGAEFREFVIRPWSVRVQRVLSRILRTDEPTGAVVLRLPENTPETVTEGPTDTPGGEDTRAA